MCRFCLVWAFLLLLLLVLVDRNQFETEGQGYKLRMVALLEGIGKGLGVIKMFW